MKKNVKSIQCNKCGNTVYLFNGFTNTCGKCGTDYNGFGQELAPRSQWGWETGENIVDIINPRDDYDY